jgi:hypothetical protein
MSAAPIRPDRERVGPARIGPGLEPATAAPIHPDLECAGSHCITCSDAADEMTVVAVDRDRGLALCDDGAGRRASVETLLVGDAAAGERLLVHAGTAIARLS